MSLIPKKTDLYYVINDAELNGNRIEADTIRQLSNEEASSLGAKVEPVQFSRLAKIEQDIDHKVSHFKKQYAEIESSPRFVDAPSMREYELEQLRSQLDTDIQQLREKYDEEARLYSKEMAKKSLEVPKVSEDEKEQASFAVGAAEVMAASGDAATALRLLSAQLDEMTDGQRTEVAKRFGTLRSVIDPNNRNAQQLLSEVYAKASESLKSVQEFRKHSRQLEILQRDYSPTSSYGLLKRRHKAYKGGR